MDPSVLELGYSDMLKHAKELGIVFTDRKPKKEAISEQIKEHYDKQAEKESTKKTKTKVTRKAKKETVDNNEAEDVEPKKKKVKKVKKTAEAVEEPVEVSEEAVAKPEKVKKVKKVKKTKAKKDTTTEEPEEVHASEEPETEQVVEPKVKKVKKVAKTTLKNNETEEMKRLRRSIMEKKAAKLNKSTASKKAEQAASQEEDEAEAEEEAAPVEKRVTREKRTTKASTSAGEVVEKKKKKVKKTVFAEDKELANISGDASNKMKRKIMKKKKKSSSPVLKPVAAASKTLDLEKSIVEVNEEIDKEEAINDAQFQLQLDSEDSNEPIEKEQPETNSNPRRSVAFTISTTPVQAKTIAKTPVRKSIAFTTVESPATTRTPNITNTRKSVAFTIAPTPENLPQKKTPSTARRSFVPQNEQMGTPLTSNNRRSIAFTIENTPTNKTPVQPPQQQARRSIVVNVPVEQPVTASYPVVQTPTKVPVLSVSVLTNDESQSELNTTYEKPATESAPAQITSPVVSCNSFYKSQQPEPAVAAVEQPKPRARIVRPKQIETTVEAMWRPQRGDQTEVVVKKAVEVVQREAGPRIVKPTQPSPKVENTKPARRPLVGHNKPKPVVKKPEPVLKPTTPKSASKPIPDFKAIHARQFQKQEDVKDAAERLKQRHNLLTANKPSIHVTKPTAETSSTAQSAGVVGSLLTTGSNLLKKMNPFGAASTVSTTTAVNTTVIKPNSTVVLPKSKPVASQHGHESSIPKLKVPEREPFKPRTPLGVRSLNACHKTPTRNPKTPNSKTPRMCNKTPTSNNLPKPAFLNSAKKPAMSRPFQFQNQNLESNINFAQGACQFGKNSGTTPLKDSAFARRKSYNPRESIGRQMSYQPHIGRLKPVEKPSVNKPEFLNDSVSAKTASVNSIVEKRKSIFGLQREGLKEQMHAKRKVMRNNEMDRPRVL